MYGFWLYWVVLGIDCEGSFDLVLIVLIVGEGVWVRVWDVVIWLSVMCKVVLGGDEYGLVMVNLENVLSWGKFWSIKKFVSGSLEYERNELE